MSRQKKNAKRREKKRRRRGWGTGDASAELLASIRENATENAERPLPPPSQRVLVTPSPKPEPKEKDIMLQPVLRFTPYAWAKLLYLRDKGQTEVGGYGISYTNDLMCIQDFRLVKQECTSVTVKFDPASVADYYEDCVEDGLVPEQFARIWIHTHPGASPTPSSTDEENFRSAFDNCHWAIMFIIAEKGATYCRLKYNGPPGLAAEIQVMVDWKEAFLESNHEAWDKEYEECVKEERWERNYSSSSSYVSAGTGGGFSRTGTYQPYNYDRDYSSNYSHVYGDKEDQERKPIGFHVGPMPQQYSGFRYTETGKYEGVPASSQRSDGRYDGCEDPFCFDENWNSGQYYDGPARTRGQQQQGDQSAAQLVNGFHAELLAAREREELSEDEYQELKAMVDEDVAQELAKQIPADEDAELEEEIAAFDREQAEKNAAWQDLDAAEAAGLLGGGDADEDDDEEFQRHAATRRTFREEEQLHDDEDNLSQLDRDCAAAQSRDDDGPLGLRGIS